MKLHKCGVAFNSKEYVKFRKNSSVVLKFIRDDRCMMGTQAHNVIPSLFSFMEQEIPNRAS
jgi:hypothetical protein